MGDDAKVTTVERDRRLPGQRAPAAWPDFRRWS